MHFYSQLGFKTKHNQSRQIQKYHYKNIIMGAFCVKSSGKQSNLNHHTRMTSLEHQLRHCEQNLIFTMTIEHLRLTNMTDKVKQIKFSLESQFQMIYQLNQFDIHENLIKSEKIHKTQFQFPAKQINSKLVVIQIIGPNNQTVQTLNLKLIHLCTGPVHHDHLLKQLRSRLMFDLHLYQNINLIVKCKDLNITLHEPDTLNTESVSYRLTLMTQIDQKTPEINTDGDLTNYNVSTEKKQLNVSSIPNNVLKQSNFRFDLLRCDSDDDSMEQTSNMIHSIFIPYRKIQSFDTFTSLKKTDIDYIRKSIPINQPLKLGDKIIGSFTFLFQIQSSILYVEPMQCLIMSQQGVGFVSPSHSCLKNDDQIKDIYNKIKKLKSISVEQRLEIVKNLDEIHNTSQNSTPAKFTSEEEIYDRQMIFLRLLNQLTEFFVQGDYALNEKLWSTINYIVHKPQLSIRYLTLHQNKFFKREVYLHYYKFIAVVLSKVIAFCEMGISYNELQFLQKFIAFSYFRFPWIQDKIFNTFTRKQDPKITEEKLIQYGASSGSKSPSKSSVYDWEQNIYKKIQNDNDFKQVFSQLENVSIKYDGWDRLLFNREDDELFYGLYLEIWTQAEITLANYKGKILWQYFPNYGKLLSCFLGEMNNSRMADFSNLFKLCSNKLVLNEKLLNTFVIQLFPKTYLYEISCVLKCLNLLQSYFEVLMKQNKKLPHDFHINFFYTGVKSILQQNHSYLVVKVLYILYKYYDIFTQQFKKILNTFLLSSIFYGLFLHWCTNVRQMFHHLICYQIIPKKVFNPEQLEPIHSNKSPFNDSKDKLSSEQIFINRKIKIYLQQIKKFSDEIKQTSKSEIKMGQQIYHEKMKLKIEQRRKKRNKDKQRFEDISDNKNSEDLKPSFLIRKQSLFSDNNDFLVNRLRKMSLPDQDATLEIRESYRKYCSISLSEYQQIKRKGKSLVEVEKLAKLVEGDIEG